MSCAEKRFCEKKAVSSCCRVVLFLSIIIILIIVIMHRTEYMYSIFLCSALAASCRILYCTTAVVLVVIGLQKVLYTAGRYQPFGPLHLLQYTVWIRMLLPLELSQSRASSAFGQSERSAPEPTMDEVCGLRSIRDIHDHVKLLKLSM